VYKQGQAGITKASVSVIFDNTDTSQSPVGYEHCSELTVTRQVQLGGKSKYVVNGRTTPANAVQNLFHSVQLNVNNPHFLIMQGRITKVLNMKPREILGMVEEAAGTRMYETKKGAAVKTIAKKQLKVNEINSLLNEEITPTLERLRGEKQQYLKWSKNNADLERMERYAVASEYMDAQRIMKTNQADAEKMQEDIEGLETQIAGYVQQMDDLSNEMTELSKKYGEAFEKEFHEAKTNEEEKSKALVKATTAWKNSEANAAKAKEDLKETEALLSECRELVESKQREILQDENDVTVVKEAAIKAQEHLKKLQERYQNLSAGISDANEEGGGLTLTDQITEAYNGSRDCEAKIQQAEIKSKHLSKIIQKFKKDLKKEETSVKNLTKKRDIARIKLSDLEQKLSNLQEQHNFDGQEFRRIENAKTELESVIANLEDEVNASKAQLQVRFNFQYQDPVRGFDRSRVKGLVAELFQVDEKNHCTALEVVAGRKLYQVVVEDAITAKALLDKGKLPRAVTIVPLDKIRSRQLSANTFQSATKVASQMNAHVYRALDLVTFDEEIRSAMEYVFGNTLVVDQMDAASKICDATRTRVVTFEGDVFDPSGVVSGGSKGNLGTTLLKKTQLTKNKKLLKSSQDEFKKLEDQFNRMEALSKEYEDLKDALDFRSAELASLENNLSQTSYGITQDKMESALKELEVVREENNAMTLKKEELWNMYSSLKSKEDEMKLEREKRLESIVQSIEDVKLTVQETSASASEVCYFVFDDFTGRLIFNFIFQYHQAESNSQKLELELKSLKEDCIAADEAVAAAQRAFITLKETKEKHEVSVNEHNNEYNEAKKQLGVFEGKMSSFKDTSKRLAKENDLLLKQKESATLNMKKLSVQVAQFHRMRSSAEKSVELMLKKYPWIVSEREAFGVTGGDYDFTNNPPGEASAKLKVLKEEQEKLAKKINKKVLGMIEKAEGEYSELLRKRKVVENDKKKIEAVILELDEKKKIELERTWVKVNRDFGSIFSTLLPGTSAKLEPPDGMDAWEGLEVKVAFGEVWKESLSELSGGQRSLLALSLILSLLLFKPAPMYILDEVDAALDLSHTQNIGNMLKSHFSQSQFIVVSLKVRFRLFKWILAKLHLPNFFIGGDVQQCKCNLPNKVYRWSVYCHTDAWQIQE